MYILDIRGQRNNINFFLIDAFPADICLIFYWDFFGWSVFVFRKGGL